MATKNEKIIQAAKMAAGTHRATFTADQLELCAHYGIDPLELIDSAFHIFHNPTEHERKVINSMPFRNPNTRVIYLTPGNQARVEQKFSGNLKASRPLKPVSTT